MILIVTLVVAALLLTNIFLWGTLATSRNAAAPTNPRNTATIEAQMLHWRLDSLVTKLNIPVEE